MCVLFHTEKHVWPIKIFPEGISILLRRQIWVSKKSSRLWNYSVPENQNNWLELCCNFEESKLQSYKVNPFTLYSLWVRFFLPIGHIDQGMTHLRRLCVTVGAASQISYMLTEAICFYNTKYHLDLCRTIITKTLLKALHCNWDIVTVSKNWSIALRWDGLYNGNVLHYKFKYFS